MIDWVEIFRSDSTLESQIISKAVEQYGISTFILNENLAALVGMGGLGLPCRVLVRAQDFVKAKEIINRLEGPRLIFSADIPKHCPACGVETEPGFDTCWKCEAAL